jgi:hypothetical protein
MKKVLFAFAVILLIAACTKETQTKVTTASQSNSTTKPVYVNFDTTSMCYDGTAYHAKFTVINGDMADSIFAGFISADGVINQETLIAPNADTVIYNITAETPISSGVAAYVFCKRGIDAGETVSPFINQNCGIRRTIINKLKDRRGLLQKITP